MVEKIWLNGNFADFDDANIHITTHSLHYGDAVFEGIHSYDARKGVSIFRLRDHVDRLFESARPLGLTIQYSKQHIIDIIKKIIKINKLGEAYIRPIVFYGSGSLDVYPKDLKTEISIIGVPYKSASKGPIRVKTSSFKRVNADASRFGAKISGFYANSIMAMHEARKQGYDEALMLDSSGNVAEGPCHNIFMVRDNELVTSDSRSILPGITRLSLMTLSKDLGFKVLEEKIGLRELKGADEVFYCGTLSEIVPIESIDGKKIGDGKCNVTEKLRSEFKNIVSGKNEKYIHWLDFV